MKEVIRLIIQRQTFVTIVDTTGNETKYTEPKTIPLDDALYDDIIFLTQDRENGITECLNVNSIVKVY